MIMTAIIGIHGHIIKRHMIGRETEREVVQSMDLLMLCTPMET
jgi:hypothetical protein